jgi:hypothetical protein
MTMQRIIISAAACLAAFTLSNAVEAETASQREYKRGYDDCLAGRYDQNRHGASYKKGCHASEAKGTGQPSSDFLSKDKQACLRAVRKQTNNPKVVVVSVEFSEANNSVTLGVGPQRAPWRCLVKNGTVAEVTSLTDEGKM